MRKIGVVGQGYVGTAVKTAFEKHYKTFTFDLNGNCNCESILDLVDESDIIFVCVPTPMKKDGSCDVSIVESVIDEIEDVDITGKIVVIKSTVPPGTTERLNQKCENIQVIFNPEFLTEANYIEDFKNQNRIILGGVRPATTKVKQVYSKVLPKTKVIKTGSTHAEMVKYMTNTFLATKVSFANEMKQVCDKLDIDYDKVVEYATYDDRLGKSHWAVPGPDGKLGFGGSCFPKDINALISLSSDLNLWLHTIKGAWFTNCDIRPEQDWKELKGRAVTDE